MRLGDGESPRQPEADALLFALRVLLTDEEPLEQVLLVGNRDAGTVVGHRPTDHVVTRASHPHRDPSAVGRVAMGIGDEIEQRPIDAWAVADHADGRAARDAQLDGLSSALGKRPDRRYGRLSELGSIELPQLEPDGAGSIACEVEDLA